MISYQDFEARRDDLIWEMAEFYRHGVGSEPRIHAAMVRHARSVAMADEWAWRAKQAVRKEQGEPVVATWRQAS